jgi:hypothetical protein
MVWHWLGWDVAILYGVGRMAMIDMILCDIDILYYIYTSHPNSHNLPDHPHLHLPIKNKNPELK